MSAWSHSRVGTFEQCPAKYAFKYVDRLPENLDSIDGFLGARVHDTIEFLYAERVRGLEPNLADALRAYDASWEWALQTRGYPTVVRAERNVVEYVAEGQAIVEKFFPRFVDDPLRTMRIECEVSCEVVYRPDPTSHQTFAYHGFVDRLARGAGPAPFDGDILVVIDYKTSKHEPRKLGTGTLKFEGKEADQLESYALCLFKNMPTLGHVYLIADFVRSGHQARRVVTRDDMARIERRVAGRIASAAAATDYPPIPSRLCDWCGYAPICPGKQTGEGSPF